MTYRKIIPWILTAIVVAASGNAIAVSRGLELEYKASEAANAPVAGSVRLYDASYALVIGNDAYRDWPRLSNAVKDAELVAAELESQGFEVTLRRNLTSTQLKSVLEEFYIVKGADKNARLMVWYAGHGETVNGEGYLVPIDAPRVASGSQFKFKALSLRRFGEYVRQAEAKHAMAVFDSCFAGTIFGSTRDKPPPAVTRSTGLPVRQFLTSGDAGEAVSDDGTFRKLFIRALRGEERADANGDGYLTGSELGNYLGDRVVNLQMGQTPRYGKLRDPDYDRGDFVFSLGETVSTSVASKPDGASPEIGLVPVEEEYIVVRNANVRSLPNVNAQRVAFLEKNTKIYVSGSVKDKPWLAVERQGQRLGFVYSPLLEPIAAQSVAVSVAPSVDQPKQVDAKKTQWQVILDNGITLGDWLALAEDRLKQGDFVAIVAEGDKLRRRYGAYPDLTNTIYLAALGDIRSRQGMDLIKRVVGYKHRFGNIPGLEPELTGAVAKVMASVVVRDEETARSALATVSSLQKMTGETMPLLELQALAHHEMNEFPKAEVAYTRWLRLAPADHSKRKKMVNGLLLAQAKKVRGPKTGDTFKDCNDCPEMVVVPPGSFQMGDLSGDGDNDERPVHHVTIPKAFAVGKFEVTQAQWEAVMGSNPSHYKGSNKPVENVSWDEAKEYILKLNNRLDLPGRPDRYRLLSEAEWEYVARAGTETKHHFGNAISKSHANYDGSRTVDVGQYPANGFGLHGVHGNVWEWTEDCWNESYAGAPSNGIAWISGNCGARVLRGGSWGLIPGLVRSAARDWSYAGYRSDGGGFRVARTLPR